MSSDGGVTHDIETEKWNYVVDKGPLCGITTATESMEPDAVNLFSFRAFGLPSSMALSADIAGHYVVNMDTLPDLPSAQIIELPGLVSFHDPGLVSMFALYFKAGSNGKLYACCIPTTLKSKPDPDAAFKHITDKDIRLYQITLIKSISTINDENGQPFRKNFNTWVKDAHSAQMKRLKVKCLGDVKVKLRPSSFVKNITDSVRAWAETLQQEASADCGAEEDSTNSTRSTTENENAVQSVTEKNSALVKKVEANLLEHVKALSVAVGFRIVEVGCSEPVTDDLISRWLDKCVAPNHYEQLKKTFKDTDMVDKLGKLTVASAPLPVNSPVKTACAPAREDADDDVEEIPPIGVELRTKRKQTERYSTLPEKEAPPTQANSATTNSSGSSGYNSLAIVTPALDCDGKKTRKYVRSGKYVQDPAKRAHLMAGGKKQGNKDPIKPPRDPQNKDTGKGACAT